MNASYAVAATTAAAVTVAGMVLLLTRALKAAHQRPGPAGHGASSQVGASERGPGGRVVESRILRLATGTIRALLRLGLPLGPMMMLTVPGRKTGLPRTNPVDLFEQDGQQWLVATHQANSSWVLNLRAAGSGTLARGGRRLEFTASELGPQEAARVLQAVLGPRLARPLAGLVLRETMGIARQAPAQDYVSAVPDHPVFALTMVPASPGVADLVRRRRGPAVTIAAGLLVAAAHGGLAVAGVMTRPQWISGIAIGLLIAGLGNHQRIFGARSPDRC